MSALDGASARLYATVDEEQIRAAAQVRTWTESGLLTKSQGTAIESALSTTLRRTNRYLRIALFIFATIVVFAAVGLWIVTFNLQRDWAVAWTAIVAGLVGLALARLLAARFRLYRFGVEEACAVWAVALLAFGAGFLTSTGGSKDDLPALVASLITAIGSFVTYAMFGYLYAGFAGLGAAASAAFFVGLPRFAAHLVAALILLAAFLAARTLRAPHGDDYPGDDYGVFEAVAWMGSYAVLNLQLWLDFSPAFLGRRAEVPSAFYWATYVAIWLLPPLGLRIAIRERQRPMLWASLVMGLATLLTNKRYLGWEQHTWDPILLGLLLVATAIVVRRWLLTGTGGSRNGFTSESIVTRADREMLGMVGTFTSAAAQPFAARTTTETQTFDAGHGGRSGGGGGGTDF